MHDSLVNIWRRGPKGQREGPEGDQEWQGEEGHAQGGEEGQTQAGEGPGEGEGGQQEAEGQGSQGKEPGAFKEIKNGKMIKNPDDKTTEPKIAKDFNNTICALYSWIRILL